MKDLNQTLNQLLSQLKDTYDLNQIEIGPISTPLTLHFYENWIAENLHAEMLYLKDHLPIKANPTLLNQNIKSVITITQNYFPLKHPLDTKIPARIATYAQNKDYHFWLKDKLNGIISELKSTYPEHDFLPYVDSGPVLERNWAYENRMGWFGKNTCLIHPKFGSLFFIAEILTTLPFEHKTKLEPLPDFCGKCQKCIEICPTNALSKHKVDASKCISYLTIESKTNPPLELREKMSDWFFGCDLCQTVCPWNEKVFRTLDAPNPQAISTEKSLTLNKLEQKEQVDFFKILLTSSNKQIQKMFTGTPLFRSGGNGLKRNALIVIANQKITQLKDEVSLLKDHPKLGELAIWCFDKIS